ncbi:MAG: S-adenosylmethionine:tRNA ribosyltransferase-isomerase [Owenweeksia sp.]|nr:S-adenosylmethionine:tRNA ribosyltransferase-isomerase [Owenweeksia sp.]
MVNQWEPYRHYQPPTPKKAFAALAQKLIDLNLDMVTARTSLIIAPGYAHRICSGLITNFHQPRSTLLLLVASFIGEDWKKIYHYALKHDFRFLSYGDACLILKD